MDLGVFDVNLETNLSSDIVFKECSEKDALNYKEKAEIDKRIEAIAAISNIPLVSTSSKIIATTNEENADDLAEKRPLIEILDLLPIKY